MQSRTTRVALALFAALVFAILYVPIFLPIASSFFEVKYGVVHWDTPSVASYGLLVANESVLDALLNTFIVGAGAVFLSIAIGVGLALYTAWDGAIGRSFLAFLIFLPFLMPPIITGLSLLVFFREVDVDRSLLTVIAGHTVFVLALVHRTVAVRLAALGHSLVEASLDLGASRWQTFWHVLRPNLMGAIIGGGVLAFVLSFDETMITLLVTGTESTLPVRLWAMMRLGFTPDINALVAVILTLTTALCLVAARYLDPKQLVR